MLYQWNDTRFFVFTGRFFCSSYHRRALDARCRLGGILSWSTSCFQLCWFHQDDLTCIWSLGGIRQEAWVSSKYPCWFWSKVSTTLSSGANFAWTREDGFLPSLSSLCGYGRARETYGIRLVRNKLGGLELNSVHLSLILEKMDMVGLEGPWKCYSDLLSK